MSTVVGLLPNTAINGKAQTPKLDKNDSKKNKNKKKKKKKNRSKPQELPNGNGSTSNHQQQENDNNAEENVEIEYVAANPLEDLDPNDPAYQEFASIFEHFTAQANEQEAASASDGVSSSTQASEDGKSGGGGDDDEDEDGKPKISRKQQKKLKRISIAVLKQLVKKPEVVEAWDVTSADPSLLVYLKSYRNTVGIPRHWNQKRKYLQGKRGIEKPPFALPDFIAQTGISKIRQAILEKEDNKQGKTRAREKMAPKLGKMDIDYQVLHDAFFRYQTKPKLTIHGDLYYEGKEFEITLKEKRPGLFSDELKRALGMPEGAPPPWLLNMQRFGPPPSYPNLKIPGLNAPIPEGARYGYHPGGWGKPPVDEFGRPVYGDVFGTLPPPPEMPSQPIERKHWGELEEEEEEVEEAEEEGEEANGEKPSPDDEPPASGFETPSGIETPSGMDTPETLELRKAPASGGAKRTTAEDDDSNKQLFHVVQETQISVGGSFLGSSHRYVIPGSEKKVLKAKNAVDLIKSQASEKLDITLAPTEVENLEELTEEVLLKKYEQAQLEKQKPKEDVSDILAENLQKKKRKKDSDKDSKHRKQKEFKF